MSRLTLALKALRQLGFFPVILKGLYHLGVKTGWYRLVSHPNLRPIPTYPVSHGFLLDLPDPVLLRNTLGEHQAGLLAEADEICGGQVRLFGCDPSPLQLLHPSPLKHWSRISEGEDIKFVWEPARLAWVYTLGRAYLLSHDESYSQCFWKCISIFLDNNPPDMGPNWVSGQEVALRIMALVFAHQVFSSSPFSAEIDQGRLLQAVAAHASRIPPTLIYARAQNNNHLLTEAAGLFTAGVYLKGFREAVHWQKMGWKWFNTALANQIAPSGVYIQHSMNYHRLMLQTALWVDGIAKNCGSSLPPENKTLLAASSHWLLDQMDPLNGKTPNLGHNDGAHILPLSQGAYADYRPVAQAAARAFLDRPCLPPGPWDEFCLWLGLPVSQTLSAVQRSFSSQSIFRLGTGETWGTLRAAQFSARPAHADQLHVDLWWKGANIALDPGTYRYTALPPWNNALSRTAVHNTLVIDDLDQMTSAGRFLWLDWAQALNQSATPDSGISAEHTGYDRIGIRHRRALQQTATGWQIQDDLVPQKPDAHTHKVTLHWLLPDWPWKLEPGGLLTIRAPEGIIHISIACQPTQQKHNGCFRLVRGGTVIFGPPADLPTLGWFSPTYGQKDAALSFQFLLHSALPLTLTTTWVLEGVQLH